jgi:hypothetical protein
VLAHWLCLAEMPGLAAPEEPGSSLLAEVNFEPGDWQLSVPIRIAARDYRFGLATRATGVFGKQFAEVLRARLHGVGDDASFAFRTPPRASIGGLKTRFPHALCLLDADQNDKLGPCDGVVGLDVLAHYIVEIDFDNGKIRFLRRLSEEPGDRFEIISLQKRPRLCAVIVRARCGTEAEEDFSVELERPDSIYVRSSLARRLLKKEQLQYVHGESTFDSTSYPVDRLGTASAFTIGRFRTENVRAVVYMDNVIGLGYLSRFVATFDFPNAAMYLRPGKQFDRYDGYDVSGLVARMLADGLQVFSCENGSPAAAAGLRKGDTILDVNAEPVDLKRPWAFRKLIRNESSTLRVHFRRDGTDQTVDMVLTPLDRGEAAATDCADSYNNWRRDSVPNFRQRSAPGELPDTDVDREDEILDPPTVIPRPTCQPAVR